MAADDAKSGGVSARPRWRFTAKAPMTADEARLIVQQFERGTLDMSLPGTEEIVAEAHRVRLKAQLWGTDRRDDRRRQAKGTVVVVCAFIVVTVVGLVACLAVTV
ncbi:hypothetical protein [Humibacter albus]|uniref:hypothetical protein n=1 Tax=Humibacter albus TaxID=427754 RepID=UPI0003B5B1BE|nr:hypothetical protein [Humibacter albus]